MLSAGTSSGQAPGEGGRTGRGDSLRDKLVMVEAKGRDYERGVRDHEPERADALFVAASPVLICRWRPNH